MPRNLVTGTCSSPPSSWNPGVEGQPATTADFNALLEDQNEMLTTSCFMLTGSATYDPPSLADGAGASTTVTVTGAILGDYAIASFSLSTQGILVTANVTAANTVTVRFQNETTGPIDLLSGTLRAAVIRAGTV